MKKALLSFVVIAAFAGYALYQHFHAVPVAAPTNNIQNNPTPISQNPPTPTDTNPTTTTPAQQVATTTPTPVSKGKYIDGSYTGDLVDAFYGKVQVQAVIQNGKLADVKFLAYPTDRGESMQISNRSLPILKNEAIVAQSSQIDIVTGATQTSQGFIQSLQSALTQAKS